MSGDQSGKQTRLRSWPSVIAWTIQGVYQALLAWLAVGTWWADAKVTDPLNPAIFILMWIVLGLAIGFPLFFTVRGLGALIAWLVSRLRSG